MGNNLKKDQSRLSMSILTGLFPQELQDEITPAGKLTTENALRVYHNDYTSRLCEALGRNFESVWAITGDEDFFKLAKGYLDIATSSSYDLGQFGQNFPQYIEGHEVFENFPFLYELAMIDMTYNDLFHKAYKPGIKPEIFSNINNIENKKFEFIDTIALFESKFPILDLWNLRHRSIDDGEVEINMDKSSKFCMYKFNSLIRTYPLSNFQFEIMYNLIKANSLDQAIEVSMKKYSPESEDEISSLFSFIAGEFLVKKLHD